FRNINIVGQRRAAEDRAVDLHHAMFFRAEQFGDFRCRFELAPMPLAIIKRERVRFVAQVACDRERRGRIKTAAEKNNRVFHRPSRPIFFSEASGYSARTVSAIPPRAENCAVMIASRGEQALTKSSRIRFVTASLNARSLRYDAK